MFLTKSVDHVFIFLVKQRKSEDTVLCQTFPFSSAKNLVWQNKVVVTIFEKTVTWL